MSKFNFMTPVNTGTTGFVFGGNKTAPTFDLGATPSGGGLTFGNSPASAPGFGTPATSAPAFGTSFGTPSTAAPAFGTSFGTPATAAPGFGTNFSTPGGAAPNFGSAFGVPATSASAFGTTGFGFNTATTSAPSTGLLLGGSSLAPTGGPNFGAAVSSAAGGLGGFSFGGTTTATTAATGGLNFSFGGAALNTTNPQVPGLNFGKPATSLGDATKPATTASIGLGGVDSAGLGLSSLSGGTGTAGAGQAPSPRAAPLPVELLQTVEDFKNSVRQRKQLSSDIARYSIRPLHKVSSDADSLLQEASELNAKLLDKRRSANSLRTRAATTLPAAERAHRTSEAPHGVEYESGEAVAWISGVVAEGESRLRLLRRQLEAAERQLGASPKPVSDQELTLGMRRIHESFVAVAGRLQAVHQLVEAQKAQYISLRRNVLKDPTDVFAEKGQGRGVGASFSLDPISRAGPGNTILPAPSAVVNDPLAALGVNKAKANSLGPTPFSLLGPPGFGGLSFSAKAPTTAPNTLGNTSWSLSSPPSGLGAETGAGVGNLCWTLRTPEQGPFALQKPPAGNKRGKH